jgi:hypothetical protein
MGKWNSRKLWLMTALFVMAQVYKGKGIIQDVWWFAASAFGTFGYAVLELYFRNKNKDFDRG